MNFWSSKKYKKRIIWKKLRPKNHSPFPLPHFAPFLDIFIRDAQQLVWVSSRTFIFALPALLFFPKRLIICVSMYVRNIVGLFLWFDILAKLQTEIKGSRVQETEITIISLSLSPRFLYKQLSFVLYLCSKYPWIALIIWAAFCVASIRIHILDCIFMIQKQKLKLYTTDDDNCLMVGWLVGWLPVWQADRLVVWVNSRQADSKGIFKTVI